MLRGRFQNFLIILSGKSVLCGHFQIFLLKFLKITNPLSTIIKIMLKINVLFGNNVKINNSGE